MVQSGKFGLVGIGLRIMKIKLNFNIKIYNLSWFHCAVSSSVQLLETLMQWAHIGKPHNIVTPKDREEYEE